MSTTDSKTDSKTDPSSLKAIIVAIVIIFLFILAGLFFYFYKPKTVVSVLPPGAAGPVEMGDIR